MDWLILELQSYQIDGFEFIFFLFIVNGKIYRTDLSVRCVLYLANSTYRCRFLPEDEPK